MASRTLRSASEWRANWSLLVCCMLGISTPMIAIYALGQFLLPLEQEFGWSRTQASLGLSVSMILGFVVAPFVGRLVDKVNVRWLALLGLVLQGSAIAAFSLANDNIAVWIGLWSLHALASALVGPTIWLAVVSTAFERNRSLAITVALSGTALATGLGPAVARFLVDAYGWRGAFQLLGLFWVAPPLIFSALFFFDNRVRTRPITGTPEIAVQKKQRLSIVFFSPTFIRLASAVAMTSTAASAYSINLAPALSGKGLNLDEAAIIAGIAGLSAIPGKLAAGSLFDRYGMTTVTTLIMVLFSVACALFAIKSEGVGIAVIASITFGLTAGANFALGAVITSKLFSVSVFGVVYGTLMSLSGLGAAIGPLAASAIYDVSGSYAPAFWAGVGVATFAAILLSNLSPVPMEGEVRR